MSDFDTNVFDALKPSLRKCGDITISTELDKKIFALNCCFCATICLKLEKFVLHIEKYHSEQLYEYIVSNAEDEHQEDEQDQKEFTVSTTTEVSTLPQKEHRIYALCKEETENANLDPLEESIVMKEESSLQLEDELLSDFEDFYYENDIEKNAQQTSNMESSSTIGSQETETENEEDSEVYKNEFANDDKNFIMALIAGYKKHKLLWDTNDPMRRSCKKREEAFRKIATSIKQQTGIYTNWQTIRLRIKEIVHKYRSEFDNEMLVAKQDNNLTPLWYYKHLDFLSNSMNKQRNKRGAKALANEKSALPLPNFTDAENIQLIEIYQSYPSLWDVEHIGFRFKNQRQEALSEMLLAIKTNMSLTFTQDELQKKLYRIRHACTQEKHRQLQCESTNEPFKPSCKLYDKIAFLLPHVGPFKCTYCAQTFNGADQYKIHTSKHNGSMPFTCPLCKRGFMKVGNCIVHLRRHTRDYPFECQECGKRFATTTDINVHMRYHTGEKPYFCEICGQSFRTWTFFDAHMRRHKKRPSHKCTICSKAFYENNKLTEHMKAHMNVRDKVCNVCGKAFTSAKYLRQHKQIHAEKKKYACKICGKDFAQYAGLSGHMKSHGTTLASAAIADEKN